MRVWRHDDLTSPEVTNASYPGGSVHRGGQLGCRSKRPGPHDRCCAGLRRGGSLAGCRPSRADAGHRRRSRKTARPRAADRRGGYGPSPTASSTRSTKQIDLWMGVVRSRGEALLQRAARINNTTKGGSMALKCIVVFFFNDTATTEIYTLSLHDALPI